MAKDDLYFDDINGQDFKTDYERGIVFKSVDGSEHQSMAAVRQANNEYWDRFKFGSYLEQLLDEHGYAQDDTNIKFRR